MKNKDVRKLYTDLINCLNSHDIIIEVKALVLENLLRDVQKQADQEIIRELEEERNAESVQPDLLGGSSKS